MTIREEKAKVVAEVAEKLKAAPSTILADYRGMTVAEATRLRRELREAGVELKVVKNTLTRIAADSCGFNELDQYLTGPTAVAFSLQDPVSAAKVMVSFAKDNKTLQIKGGLVEGKVVGLEQIKALAELPSREVLLSQVVRGFNGPITGLAMVLAGPIRKLAYALKAVSDQKAAV